MFVIMIAESEVSNNNAHLLVTLDNMSIHTMVIVDHIRDPRSFAGSCYEVLKEDEKIAVLKEIEIYAIKVVCGFMDVKPNVTTIIVHSINIHNL